MPVITSKRDIPKIKLKVCQNVSPSPRPKNKFRRRQTLFPALRTLCGGRINHFPTA
ncbi:hypothetical protein HMPREF9012_1900 [Bacteroidetes bacterium oral taxon 272 str. F0290]|nr:hypothetical protein HMPREF9012_1900 [Bacteroidetes bacterium oral taxon 272 str. F0290]